MPTLWRVRAIVCLLLAVSTAIGAVVPARACACAAPARTPIPPVNQRDAAPQPAAKSCCQSAAKKRSCCAPTEAGGTGTKPSCCGDKAPADRSGKLPTAPTTADAPGCHCLRCDCEAPPAPAPAPVATDLDDQPTASPVPTVLTLGSPTTASRAVCCATVPPPIDLTISLSRLTC